MRKTLTILLSILLLASSLGAAEAQTGCAPSQLIPYQAGRVTPGSSNRLRDIPSSSGDLLGEIPGDGLVIVLETGVCASGYLWAKVSYLGRVGWTPEAQESTYFVNPVPLPDGAIILPVIPSYIYDVSWSADGSRIAVATADGFYLIPANSPNPAPILFDRDGVTEVVFSPTQPEVLATSADMGTVRVWDIAAWEVLHEVILEYSPNAVSCIHLCNSGSLKFNSSGESLFVVLEMSIVLYDTTTWETTGGLEDGSMGTAAMAPDGQQIAVTSFDPTTPLHLTNWSEVKTPLNRGEADWAARRLEFSPDSTMLAVAGEMGQFGRLMMSTGEFDTFTLPLEGTSFFPKLSFAFSADSTLLAVGDPGFAGVLHLLDTATMQEVGHLQPDNMAAIRGVAFSPDGERIAVIFDNLLLMVDTEAVLTGTG